MSISRDDLPDGMSSKGMEAMNQILQSWLAASENRDLKSFLLLEIDLTKTQPCIQIPNKYILKQTQKVNLGYIHMRR